MIIRKRKRYTRESTTTNQVQQAKNNNNNNWEGLPLASKNQVAAQHWPSLTKHHELRYQAASSSLNGD